MHKERLRGLLYILFPRRCYFCGAVTAAEESLCSRCAAIPEEDYVIREPRCTHCGAGRDRCACRGRAVFFSDILAPYYYVEPAHSAVRQFKFNNRPELAAGMARDMAERVRKAFPDLPFDQICCIPQTKHEMRRRGYNQSRLLALELAKQLSIPVSDALVKLRDTPRQQTLSSAARSGNVFGVFDVHDRAAVFGQNILLVDDIKTTGATLNECAKMLRLFDANTVTAAVFAVTCKARAKDRDAESKK